MSEKKKAPHPAPLPAAQGEGVSDRRIAWGLFLGAFLVLLATEKSVGFSRDESVYFQAGEVYASWFKELATSPSRALTDEAIVNRYRVNAEHPVLMKNLYGLSFILFHEKLQLLRPAAAFRVPAFAFAAWMLPLIFGLSRRLFGKLASAFAAIAFLLVPRQFFHSHLSAFDVPIATMWVLTIYCFLEALEKPRWWLYTGLAFGGALATKHNAWFIPVTLVPVILARGWLLTKEAPEARRFFFGINGVFVFGLALYGLMVLALGLPRFQQTFTFQSPQLGLFVIVCAVGGYLTWRLKPLHEGAFRTIAPLVAMAALGPVVFYLHWPYLWIHPVDRAAQYFAFHLNHEHYAWFYLGDLLRAPPFPLSYVLVKTALTVPTSLFVPMVLGFGWLLVRIVRRQATTFDWIVLGNAVMSIALISHPNVPHFGGVKHWFPSIPFLLLLSAGVFERGARALADWWSPKLKLATERNVLATLAILAGLPALIATARVQEFGTSAYSELAGGLPGAASLGMQRQYWANNLSGVLPWLNEHVQPGQRVYFHENHMGQIRDNQRNGMLRTDLVPVGSPFEADWMVYQYHQEFREHEFITWQAFGSQRPVHGLYLDETPQIVIYQRGHR